MFAVFNVSCFRYNWWINYSLTFCVYVFFIFMLNIHKTFHCFVCYVCTQQGVCFPKKNCCATFLFIFPDLKFCAILLLLYFRFHCSCLTSLFLHCSMTVIYTCDLWTTVTGTLCIAPPTFWFCAFCFLSIIFD